LLCFQRTPGKVNTKFNFILQMRCITGMVMSMSHSAQILVAETLPSLPSVSRQKEVAAMAS